MEEKLAAAERRRNASLAAKQARAAELGGSNIKNDDDDSVASKTSIKSKIEDKLEAAERRRAARLDEEQGKRDKVNIRRERARAIARQRRSERDLIAAWEDTKSLPPVHEDEEMSEFLDLQQVDSIESMSAVDDSSYAQQKLVARRQLVNEIRMANEMKFEEMGRLSRELHRPSTAQSFGTIDTQEVFSLDDGEEVIISGFSTIRENEKNASGSTRNAEAALQLAELDG